MTALVPVIPERGAPVSPDALRALERRIDEWRHTVDDIDILLEVRDRSAALEAYVHGRQMKAPAQGMQRRLEARVGFVLGPATVGSHLSAIKGTALTPEERNWFRLLADGERYGLISDWSEGRRSLVDMVRNALARNGHTNTAPTPEGLEIRRGDFGDVLADIEPSSVDLIITDPPYGHQWLDSYERLAEFAARSLRPGGSLLCLTGHVILPDVLALFANHLRYWWTLAQVQHGDVTRVPGRFVIVGWKPWVWFVRERRGGRNLVCDTIDSPVKPPKTLDDWEQAPGPVEIMIERLTEPGQLVVDPFAGTGTFGYAALRMNRRFIGADL